MRHGISFTNLLAVLLLPLGCQLIADFEKDHRSAAGSDSGGVTGRGGQTSATTAGASVEARAGSQNGATGGDHGIGGASSQAGAGGSIVATGGSGGTAAQSGASGTGGLGVNSGGGAPAGGSVSSGGAPSGGITNAGSPNTGGTASVTGATAGGVPTTGGQGNVGTGGNTAVLTPPGWWTSWKSEGWHGCPLLFVDADTAKTLQHREFTHVPNGGPYYVAGTLVADPTYGRYVEIVFNLNQIASTADCAYNPANEKALFPGVAMPTTATGIAFNLTNTGGASLVLKMRSGSVFGKQWCQNVRVTSGKGFAPFNQFRECGSSPTFDGTDSVSAIGFTLLNGSNVDVNYELTINGFSLGNSALDAPGN